MAKRGYIDVPATPADVRAFVDRYRTKYQDDLRGVRDLLRDLQARDPALRSIYKIYSRGEVQGLDELKSARKIRLKFNEFNLSRSITEATVFEVPDIIGLTVVVPYPSGISLVASALDQEIDDGALVAINMGTGDADTGIVTRHGRPLGAKGYLACHYNVRLPGAGTNRPICEIQIKTVLHDAWGAKTHDLTYKPAGRIGEELLVSFDLLGANLANLDKQSDALRNSIVQAAGVRERKRRAVQILLLKSIAGEAVAAVTDVKTQGALSGMLATIGSMNPDTADTVSKPISNKLLKVFNDGAGPAGSGVASSTLLSLLAAMTRHRVYFEQALDTLEVRQASATDPIHRLNVQLDAMLVPFAGGDVAEAIDMGEDLLRDIEEIIASGMPQSDPARFARIHLNVLSNLAYFHADLVGSHEGDKRNSLSAARDFMAAGLVLYPTVGFPPAGLMSSEAEITSAVGDADATKAVEVFFTLDNEAYVGIQCATTEAELRDVRGRLEFLHRHVPPDAAALAGLAVDYHDYCARMRLSELERATLP